MATATITFPLSADGRATHHRVRLWAGIPDQSQDIPVPGNQAVFTVPQGGSPVATNVSVRAIDLSGGAPQSTEITQPFTIPGAVQPLTPPQGTINVAVTP